MGPPRPDDYRLTNLVHEVADARAAGARVALCHGCFDLLHYGHLLHLSEARTAADRLVVTVTPDRFVNKGSGRPVYDEQQRAEMLAALRVVDAVAINEWPTAVPTIRAIKPDYFVKGIDYVGEPLSPAVRAERRAAESVGAVFLITGTPKWSSTALVPALGEPGHDQSAARPRTDGPSVTTNGHHPGPGH